MGKNLKEFTVDGVLYLAEIRKSKKNPEHMVVDFQPYESKSLKYGKFSTCILNYSKKIAERMEEEGNQYEEDGEGLQPRNFSGLCGEFAVRLLLGFNMNYINTDTNSHKEHTFDLKSENLNIGIKSKSWYDKMPLIHKTEHWPEICTYNYGFKPFKTKTVILGYASMSLLNDKKNQDDNLVRDPKCRKKGTKTIFTGLHLVKSFSTLEELIAIDKECWQNGENYEIPKYK